MTWFHMRSAVDASVNANKRPFPVRIFISNFLHGFLVYVEQITESRNILLLWKRWTESEHSRIFDNFTFHYWAIHIPAYRLNSKLYL